MEYLPLCNVRADQYEDTCQTIGCHRWLQALRRAQLDEAIGDVFTSRSAASVEIAFVFVIAAHGLISWRLMQCRFFLAPPCAQKT